MNTAITGTQRFSVRTGRQCDRCGRDMREQAKERVRKDGLVLCMDCKTDRWLVERFAR